MVYAWNESEEDCFLHKRKSTCIDQWRKQSHLPSSRLNSLSDCGHFVSSCGAGYLHGEVNAFLLHGMQVDMDLVAAELVLWLLFLCLDRGIHAVHDTAWLMQH